MIKYLLRQVRKLDIYSKPLEDFRVRTLSGGAMTLLTAIVMSLLFLSELYSYLSVEVLEELYVDTSVGNEPLRINFDVFFPSLACSLISVDALDVAGQLQSNVSESIRKEVYRQNDAQATKQPTSSTQPRANNTSVLCGSCYGAESETMRCCNTCEDVKKAYLLKGWSLESIDVIEQCQGDYWVRQLHQTAGSGCKIHGWLDVSKVAGNFHMAPGETLKDQHGHVHDLHSLAPKSYNTSHVINHLSFGESYPGKEFPLDGLATISETGGVMANYFLKIVPTVYVTMSGKRTVTHQFSVTINRRMISSQTASGMPGMFVTYEFSPLMVQLSEQKKSFSHFVTKVCAMIGGIFTVASFVDSLMYKMTTSAGRMQKSQ